MPVMPGYANADTPHARTVHLASQGWRYAATARGRGMTGRAADRRATSRIRGVRTPAG